MAPPDMLRRRHLHAALQQHGAPDLTRGMVFNPERVIIGVGRGQFA
jgi:hypothetical protein